MRNLNKILLAVFFGVLSVYASFAQAPAAGEKAVTFRFVPGDDMFYIPWEGNGEQLPLCRVLSLDFNLGIGYTRSEYDNFTVTDGVRVYREKDKAKNLFGPTQAGISLVWMIGIYNNK